MRDFPDLRVPRNPVDGDHGICAEFETGLRNDDLFDWCTNEKTAMEAALGMSYAGKRTMVCMKHVGLNVAATPLSTRNNRCKRRDDRRLCRRPSMHSSQNEQDSRVYGKFALIPILEPRNQQEAYDMVHYGSTCRKDTVCL